MLRMDLLDGIGGRQPKKRTLRKGLPFFTPKGIGTSDGTARWPLRLESHHDFERLPSASVLVRERTAVRLR